MGPTPQRPVTVDAFASQPHLYDHVVAAWRAIPPERRGTLWCPSRRLLARAELDGLAARRGMPQGDGPILVANHTDLVDTGPTRPVVYLQHGAGQTYLDAPGHESYAGGRWRQRVALFLEPHERTAAIERLAYVDSVVRVVGSPYLDELAAIAEAAPARSGPPVVALAWHFDLHLVPETRWAFDHFRVGLAALAGRDDLVVLGHGHPRAMPRLEPHYRTAGIEVVHDLAEVVARADVLACDNTSAGPLFAAATGRPVVWLNAPHYRRDVRHGGRFWDWPEGQVSCSAPSLLADAILAALDDGPEAARSRRRMVDGCWAPETRGRAGELVAEAVAATTID